MTARRGRDKTQSVVMRALMGVSLVAGSLLLSAESSAQGWEEGPAEQAPAEQAPTVQEQAPPTPVMQGERPPPPPPTAIRVETEAPAPAGPRRGFHVHDGYYLRLGVGGGYMSSKVTYDDGSVADRTISGGGLALDVMVGGTPLRGLVLGGGLWLQTASDPKTKGAGAESYKDMSFSMLGVFVDGYPDPEGGFHVGGALGIAGLDAKFRNEDLDPDPARLGGDDGAAGGVGSQVWVGYDAWVSAEWSLGGMLKFTGASLGRTNDDLEQRANVRAFSLSFTAVYH